MSRWPRFLVRIGHHFWRPLLRRRLGRIVLETVHDTTLLVLPEVFNPAVFRTGTFLAQSLALAPELEPLVPSARALDLGTGSGVGAIFAARRGYVVIAVDVNPQAVRCARINVLIHGLEDQIEVRQGDLFEPVAGEGFDLIIFNPPYFRGTPKSPLDMAWRANDVLERFAARLPEVLGDDGKALLLLSTDGDAPALLTALKSNAFSVRNLSTRTYGNETLMAVLAERE